MSLDTQYHYPVPPPDGWTAEDLDRLPDLPRHTELLDGNLVFMSPQTRFHSRVLSLLEYGLLGQVPDGLGVFREFDVRLDRRNRPSPDVTVVPADADTGPKGTWLRPEDVLLAVEAVSDDSVERDRELKPRKYAEAGFPHYWRVEPADGLPVVHVYELDPATRVYALSGVYQNRLELTVPFPIDIDLTAINNRRLR
ncbi:Uma2 family endonuclease [Streptomyces violens]|uniref:Uma2 family endonuclease n=1 Tax=Streptomyces violens TaxID=66377 RepID=UPI0004C16A37|nr:Uma2 family endonuclease [Streptomyces violens]